MASNNGNPNQQQQQPPHQGYYYATPHQLYPYMSIFYSGVQQHKNDQNQNQNHNQLQPLQQPQQQPQQQMYPTNMIPSAPLLTKYWTERNLSPINLTQPQQSLPPPPQQQHDEHGNDESALSLLQTPSEFKSFDSGGGYWDLPKPTYGKLATNNNGCGCNPKQPRIGDKYQAIIPSFKPQSTNNDIFEEQDHCVWESNKIPPKQLDEYLKIVQFVLGILYILSIIITK